MVEENSITGMNSIGFSVVDCDPISIKLCCGIGATWMEFAYLALRRGSGTE